MANHRKYPRIDPVQLQEMYWGRYMPTTKMAEELGIPVRSVNEQMRRAGIKMRRHTQPKVCIVTGCGQPTHKTEHPLCVTGSYGRRCYQHFKAHRALVNKLLKRRKEGIAPEDYKWWQEKYSNDGRLEPWRHIQKAKRSLKSLRRCVAALEVGQLPPQELLQGMSSPT